MGDEYFLVENRQLVGFDLHLPYHGLLIYHVDDTKWGNWDVENYHVALEQADGYFELELGDYNHPPVNSGGFLNFGDNGDPWPGALAKKSFDCFSTPNSRSYADDHTQVSVWNISGPIRAGPMPILTRSLRPILT